MALCTNRHNCVPYYAVSFFVAILFDFCPACKFDSGIVLLLQLSPENLDVTAAVEPSGDSASGKWMCISVLSNSYSARSISACKSFVLPILFYS